MSNCQSLQSLLENIYSFVELNSASEKALVQISNEVKFKKNEIIQPIGHICKTLYFIQSGCVRIFYQKEDIDITESFEFENNFVARAESLFSGKPSRKGIQAIEDSQLIAINSSKLFSLFDTHADLERLFRKITEKAYVKTVNRLESLQFNTAEERYNSLLKESPDVLKRVPLKFVASFLGITQVSLSRIRAK